MVVSGVTVIFISTLLTAAYLFSIVKAAYFPKEGSCLFNEKPMPMDPGLYMTIPFGIIAFMVILIGLASGPLLEWIALISRGLA